MGFGGGGFTAQNKVLPGAYINFISLSSASSNVSDRGVAAVALELDWGKENCIIELTVDEFIKNSVELFGYDYADERLKPIREILKNANSLLLYRLKGGEKASCPLAAARYGGICGNSLKIVTEQDPDTEGGFIVSTYMNSRRVDSQRVASAAELNDNSYVVFNKEETLSVNSGTALTGGTNGETVRENHQTFLNLLEEYSFDTLGLASDDSGLKSMYFSYTKRQRDSGKKFQTVLYNYSADYEGVINVENKTDGDNPASLVYWVTGLSAGTDVNETAFNRVYDGEYTVQAGYTQSELADFIKNGKFVLHKAGKELRVLADINSLVSFTADKGRVFGDNRTVRVIDGIDKDIKNLFIEKYMGRIPNNASGRAGLWADVIKMLKTLVDIGAIDSFENDDIEVEAGDDKTSVVIKQSIIIQGTMSKLYMTCVVA